MEVIISFPVTMVQMSSRKCNLISPVYIKLYEKLQPIVNVCNLAAVADAPFTVIVAELITTTTS